MLSALIRILRSRRGAKLAVNLAFLVLSVCLWSSLSRKQKKSNELFRSIDDFTTTVGTSIFGESNVKYPPSNPDWNPHYSKYFADLKEKITSIDFIETSENINQFNDKPLSPFDNIPIYDNFIKAKLDSSKLYHNKFSLKYFKDIATVTKCKYYFNNLNQINPGWNNDVNKHSLLINSLNYDKNGKVRGKKSELQVKTTQMKKNLNFINERLRLYDLCFIKNEFNMDDIFNNPVKDSVSLVLDNIAGDTTTTIAENQRVNQFQFEGQMFPYLQKFNSSQEFNSILPRFSIGDGIWYSNGTFPKPLTSVSTYQDFKPDPENEELIHLEYDTKKSVWANWNSMSDLIPSWERGIIISISDAQLFLALKWIATARHNHIKLPIFFMYKDNELSQVSINKLRRVAASDDIKFPTSSNLPKLDTWFVDLTPSINPIMMPEFITFKNKWLASTLNPCKEILFLDTDTINYKDPNFYFETKGYKNSGTLFFRDRYLKVDKKEICSSFHDTLSPSFQESFYFDKLPLFDKQYIVDNVAKNELTTEEHIFKSYFHLDIQHEMESGLMAIDKATHIIPMQMSANFNLFKPFSKCSHGDKEFFWLGFMASGTPFSIDPIKPGTVGEVITDKAGPTVIEKRICNIQIVHFDENKDIMWMNGGANICKYPGYAEADWENPKLQSFTKNFKTLAEYKKYYEQIPMKTDYGIIASEFSNQPWIRRFYHCHNLIWCARYTEELKPLSFEEKETHGELFPLDPEVKKRVDEINFVWATFDTYQVFSKEDIESAIKLARETSGLNKVLDQEAKKKAEAAKKAAAEVKAALEAEIKAKADAEEAKAGVENGLGSIPHDAEGDKKEPAEVVKEVAAP
ncbi:hypothetical protein TPHA_0F00700 [Tetrapisispora phaffii CBS 4417]|uniref:Alpha-1,3-mannosyltransferase n=1 Tax=Tetrapisispora phaffii (strain ATCC 24235 / CBS 4417 / NBRC 1672 / NRRL Y-8282 / UCD 70-5) TaxID=1071381 RepID=G8BUX4_TETPH|nr:hypothetical protein TPHA_0F00700 [Tetrapisispora phaffii CBS 4417]CCE63556.1 hypothetical protein TPHA_0F00700 [Tetrapisispora phaffii CBS 4417]